MHERIDSLFYSINPWLIALANLAFLVLASELGFHLGLRRRAATDESQRGQITTLQAAILGFLALILGFTFSISQGRFDTRRQLVIQEANAVGTTWLRAQTLPEPYRSNLSQLLARYAEARVPDPDTGSIRRAIARSEQLHGQLWDQEVAVTRNVDNPALVILFTLTLNEMIDLHTTRVAAYLYRAPAALLMLLHLSAALALGVMGYASGLDGQRHAFTAAVMVVLVAIVLGLIVDLEQAEAGMFRVNQKPLFDVRNQIEQILDEESGGGGNGEATRSTDRLDRGVDVPVRGDAHRGMRSEPQRPAGGVRERGPAGGRPQRAGLGGPAQRPVSAGSDRIDPPGSRGQPRWTDG